MLRIFKSRTYFFLFCGFALLVVLFGVVLVYQRLALDERTMRASSIGVAEWLYQDTHGEDNPLPVEKFGTPAKPLGLDIIPIANRVVSKDGTRFAGLKESVSFSLERTMSMNAHIALEATDLTPLDSRQSWDKAHMETTFDGPSGEKFKVVLKRLAPGNLNQQTFGGVMFNHLIHGETGVGTDRIPAVFAYQSIKGFVDVYKDGELIAEDVFGYIATSHNAPNVLNPHKEAGLYNVDQPMAERLIIHMVVHPYTETYEYRRIPTGVIGPDGKEQDFFHINFDENVVVSGNRFLKETIYNPQDQVPE